MEEHQWKRGNHELAQKKMDERLAKTRGVAGAPGSKEPLPTKKFQLKKGKRKKKKKAITNGEQ